MHTRQGYRPACVLTLAEINEHQTSAQLCGGS